MKINGDKWWGILLIVVCLAFGINLWNDIRHTKWADNQRNEIVSNQMTILTNQQLIMNVLSNISEAKK